MLKQPDDIKTYVIAEAGVNHNGCLDYALTLIEKAAYAGANAIKFQTFSTDELVTSFAPKAEYQKNSNEDDFQSSMLKKLELSHHDYFKIIEHCKTCHIDFLSTPFDVISLDFLVNTLNMDKIKLGSGEVTHAQLLLKAAQTNKPIILSTGMSTLGDIEQALAVLAFGYSDRSASIPDSTVFMNAFYSENGQAKLKEKVTLLHCVSSYPAEDHTIHLRAIDTLRSAFDLAVGYSDHSLGIAIPIAAVARHATVIEKHLTLDKNLAGPDHKASLNPEEFKMMVDGIRQVETALGYSRKCPAPIELQNRQIARRSLVAKQAIKQGETYNHENIATKRPGTGISSIWYWDYIGKKAEKDYQPDELICTE